MIRHLLFFALLAAELPAQLAPPPRFADATSSSANPTQFDTLSGRAPASLPAAFVLEQTAAAGGGMAVGMLVGGLAGGLIATASTDRNAGGGWEGVIGMLMGAGLVGPVGAGIAVDRFSRPRGVTSSVWAAIAGGYLGWAGGPAFYVTVPLGTVTAYNLARR